MVRALFINSDAGSSPVGIAIFTSNKSPLLLLALKQSGLVKVQRWVKAL